MFIKYGIDFQDGLDGWISIRLVYSGCNRARAGNPCKGCHNEWLWDCTFGACRRKFAEWLGKITETGWSPSGIIVTGGEPLDQDSEEVIFDINMVKKAFNKNVPVFVYTGYEWSEELKNHPVVRIASYLKVGPYNEELKCPGRFASSNQKVVELR